MRFLGLGIGHCSQHAISGDEQNDAAEMESVQDDPIIDNDESEEEVVLDENVDEEGDESTEGETDDDENIFSDDDDSDNEDLGYGDF